VKKIYLVHFKIMNQTRFTGFPAVYGSAKRACAYASNISLNTMVTEVEILPVVVN
jgi:hypothetical protein